MYEPSDLLARIEALEQELARLKSPAAKRPLGVTADTLTAADEGDAPEPRASRRDLIRLGAVALGAATAGIATTAVEAADGDPLVIGANNVGSTTTRLSVLAASAFSAVTVNPDSVAVGGHCSNISRGYGVYGSTISQDVVATPTAGVMGESMATAGNSAGVRGIARSPDAAAVHGTKNGAGIGVLAEVPAASAGSAIALYALNYSTYAGPAPGAGGFGVYGLSANGHGLVGATAAAGAAAVVGASNGVAGAYAGAFYGPVVVGGNFTVVGGAKSAAVPHPDGSHRRLYCVESPESWFEDFGRGALSCGEARISLDRDFASVVKTDEYHVFLTGHDGRCDLSVSDQTAEGFTVKSASAAAAGTFSWRVVARRKDIPGRRFETVEIPKEPALPEVPASAHAAPQEHPLRSKGQIQ